MVYKCMAQVTEGTCHKCVEGVNTQQAAQPLCSVSDSPLLKTNLKTSVNEGLFDKTKHRIAK